MGLPFQPLTDTKLPSKFMGMLYSPGQQGEAQDLKIMINWPDVFWTDLQPATLFHLFYPFGNCTGIFIGSHF